MDALFALLKSVMIYHVHAQSLSPVGLFVTPWTVCSPFGSLYMEFSRQEYFHGLPFPPPGALPNPGIEPHLFQLLHWQTDSLPLHHLRSPMIY